MSIILKSDQINFIVYKYLNEMGLHHTAFSMFHEANLESAVREYRYDIQSGHLVTLFEKALLLTQIESHIYLNAYQECKQPMQLLKAHNCEIVEKVLEQRKTLENQLSENINESIKRTNDIFFNQMRSDKVKPMSIENRVTDFLDKFPKLRLPKRLAANDMTFCEATRTLTFNQPDENRVVFVQYDAGSFETQLILPTFFNDSFSKVQAILNNEDRVCICFEGSNVVVLDSSSKVTAMFHLKEASRIVAIKENRCCPDIVCFQFEAAVYIVNIKTSQLLASHPARLFEWRYANQFVLYDGTELQLRTLMGDTLLNFTVNEPIEQMSLSDKKEYMLTVSRGNTVKIWTFLKEEALMIFEEESPVVRSLWAISKSVNYLVILTETSLKIWDLELTSFKREILLAEKIYELTALSEQNEQDSKCYLVGLTDTSLAVYDISQNRDEAVSLSQEEQENGVEDSMTERLDTHKIKQLSCTETALIAGNTMYMLEASLMKDLFE